MKLKIFLLVSLLGICIADPSSKDYGSRGEYNVGRSVPPKYRNPFPYIDNVWGTAFPEEDQKKSQSMEWQHNKILRELTQRYVEARKAEEKFGSLRNVTATLVPPPSERNMSQIYVYANGNYYKFLWVQTYGLQLLNNGLQYMVLNYDTYNVNLTFYMQEEFHLKGQYTFNDKPAEPYDIWTKSGGTKFTVMFEMIDELHNGLYRINLKIQPRCVFEPVNDCGYNENFTLPNPFVFQRLFEKVAENLCADYISQAFMQERIHHLLQLSSPMNQYNSVLNQGMLDLMIKLRDEEIHQPNGIDIGQGYTIRHCGYEVAFTNIDVEMESIPEHGVGFYLPLPTTHEMENQLVVTEVTSVATKELKVNITVSLKNSTYDNHVEHLSMTVIEPTKIVLSFVKHWNNEGESIHLGSHPDVAVGGTKSIVLDPIQDPQIRTVLENLKPVYHSVISGNFIGYLQYRLFKFFYPSYFPSSF